MTMTREEAIWWVNHLFEIRKEEYFNKSMMEDAKEVEQAQHMAIEALENQKCWINGTPFDECGWCEHFNCETCKCEVRHSDLISREDALQCKPEFLNPNPNDNPNNYPIGWNDAIKAWYASIKALPSAELPNLKQEFGSADRPIGEWRVVATTKPMYDRMGVLCWGSVYKCDQCDFTTWAVEGHFSQYNFCPNCGARMTPYKGGDK